MLISLFLVSKNPKVLFKYFTIVLSITLLISYSGVSEQFSTVPRLATSAKDNPVAAAVWSYDQRIYKYKVAWDIIQENPLLGAGPGGMPELSHTTSVGPIGMVSAHNLYLQAAVDYGFPMMLIVIIILFYSFSSGIKILKNYKHQIIMKNNRYLHMFLLASTAFVLSCIIMGFAESLTYNVIFLNLGFIIAAKRILQQQTI
jgi:O-antigen ligase